MWGIMTGSGLRAKIPSEGLLSIYVEHISCVVVYSQEGGEGGGAG